MKKLKFLLSAIVLSCVTAYGMENEETEPKDQTIPETLYEHNYCCNCYKVPLKDAIAEKKEVTIASAWITDRLDVKELNVMPLSQYMEVLENYCEPYNPDILVLLSEIEENEQPFPTTVMMETKTIARLAGRGVGNLSCCFKTPGNECSSEYYLATCNPEATIANMIVKKIIEEDSTSQEEKPRRMPKITKLPVTNITESVRSGEHRNIELMFDDLLEIRATSEMMEKQQKERFS